METTITVLLNQIIIFFVLICIGFILFKIKAIDSDRINFLSTLIIYLTNPASMFISFVFNKNCYNIKTLLIVSMFSFLYFVVLSIICKMLFNKNQGVLKSSIIFANSGFIGIPLVKSILSDKSVVFITIYCAIQIIFLWTVSIYQISQDKSTISLNKILFNPCIIIVFFGFISFLLNVDFPDVILNSVKIISDMNTGLIMILLGAFIANCNFSKVFRNKHTYIACSGRLIIIPFLSLFILKPISLPLDAKIALMIGCASPCITMTAIFSQLFNKDTELASGIIGISTLLSLVTMPIFIYFLTYQ